MTKTAILRVESHKLYLRQSWVPKQNEVICLSAACSVQWTKFFDNTKGFYSKSADSLLLTRVSSQDMVCFICCPSHATGEINSYFGLHDGCVPKISADTIVIRMGYDYHGTGWCRGLLYFQDYQGCTPC